MFFRQINDDLKVSLTIPQYAEKIFSLVDKNRSYLKEWLPWLDSSTEISDTQEFIKIQLENFYQETALIETIFYKNKIVGLVGFHKIDKINGIAYIGYWLSEEFNGKGIMTNSVKDLIKVGFEYYPINKIYIQCATENQKSQSIAVRLNFKKNDIIKNAEFINGIYLDHIVYELSRKNILSASYLV